jgi:hypothetical protein
MLVLVDTSVWVQHLRRVVPELITLLGASRVVTHSVVVGVLAVGGIRNRPHVLADLRALPTVIECGLSETLDFLERRRLYNVGLSWNDVQLLASAAANAVPIWSLDVCLQQQANALNVAWIP